MSLNKFMHPRNIYKSPPNFDDLCQQYPEFQKFVSKQKSPKKKFDFKNPEALRCLTLILLKKDFGLDLKIPENTLIPTLPLRLNYILWIEDLLNWNAQSKTTVQGIDIGTGATCIYPLLAAKKNGWKMIATEINESSVQIGKENVKNNSLEHLISIVQVSDSTFLNGVLDERYYDFCMCNPPFFNFDHISSQMKSHSDSSEDDHAPVGSTNEISTEGGEIEFIKCIIRDSTVLRDRIKIYTTMVGHKSSLQPLREELKKCDIKSSCESEFCQGRTIRWAIAWTFTAENLKVISPLTESKLPKPITWIFESKYNFKECTEVVIPQLFTQLKMQFSLLEDYKKRKLWRITARENTWTGLRRKKREQLKNEKNINNGNTNEPIPDDECEFEKSRDTDQVSPACNHQNNKADRVSLKLIDKDEIIHSSSELSVIKPQKVKEPCPKMNYCKLYALNEKRKEHPTDDFPAKKLKTDNSISNSSINDYVIQALFHVKIVSNKIELQILYEAGKKDAPQQILQYLKNHLNK